MILFGIFPQFDALPSQITELQGKVEETRICIMWKNLEIELCVDSDRVEKLLADFFLMMTTLTLEFATESLAIYGIIASGGKTVKKNVARFEKFFFGLVFCQSKSLVFICVLLTCNNEDASFIRSICKLLCLRRHA